MEIERVVRPELLGARLKSARLLAKLKQDGVAQSLGLARTTIVAIEGGKRQISKAELRAFADLYSVAESELLSGSNTAPNMEVKFRSQATGVGDDEALVASLLNRIAIASIEIETLVGSQRPMPDLPVVVMRRDADIVEQAEDAAISLRQRLGLGTGPIQDLVALMENDLGIRVYERPLPSKISGAVAYDEAHGAFVLLNSNHPLRRRRNTASHEICHLLLRKAGLEVLTEQGDAGNLEDRFCDAFARALLMPAFAVRKRLADLKSLAKEFTVRHLLMMAVYFNVSIEAMARRLEALKLVSGGLFASLKDQGLGNAHLNEVLKELGVDESPSQFTPRIYLLAGAAFDRQLISEQQLSRKLALDLGTVRRMLEQVSSEGGRSIEHIE